MTLLSALLLSLALGPPADLRSAYDVLGFRLAIAGDPEQKSMSGTCFVEARAGADGLAQLELDLATHMRATAAHDFSGDLAADPVPGAELAVARDGALVRIALAKPA